MARQHRLQVAVLRPDAVHAMFQAKRIAANLNGLTACQPAPNKLLIRFQDQWMKSALRKVQGRA